MSVTITKKSLSIALLYVESSALNITVIRLDNTWTVTATY
mgnify:CR=1 FL=1